jgi:hypothetical protein
MLPLPPWYLHGGSGTDLLVYFHLYITKDTMIKLFNAYVKSVLLYGCQTWLVTCEIHRKLQSFVNRCLQYIMKIWWPRVISNEKLWEMTGQISINKEI